MARGFWWGLGSGAVLGMLSVWGGWSLASRHVSIPRSSINRLIAQSFQSIAQAHRLELIRSATAAIDPMVDVQIRQLLKTSHLQIEGRAIRLSGATLGLTQAVLESEARTWMNRDLANSLEHPQVFLPMLSQFVIDAVDHHPIEVRWGFFKTRTAIRISG